MLCIKLESILTGCFSCTVALYYRPPPAFVDVVCYGCICIGMEFFMLPSPPPFSSQVNVGSCVVGGQIRGIMILTTVVSKGVGCLLFYITESLLFQRWFFQQRTAKIGLRLRMVDSKAVPSCYCLLAFSLLLYIDIAYFCQAGCLLVSGSLINSSWSGKTLNLCTTVFSYLCGPLFLTLLHCIIGALLMSYLISLPQENPCQLILVSS